VALEAGLPALLGPVEASTEGVSSGYTDHRQEAAEGAEEAIRDKEQTVVPGDTTVDSGRPFDRSPAGTEASVGDIG